MVVSAMKIFLNMKTNGQLSIEKIIIKRGKPLRNERVS